MEGNIGYLDLRSFRSTDYAASTALGALSFLSNSDAIVIDLRENYGGDALKTAHLLALKSLIKKTTDAEWKSNLKTLIAKIDTQRHK